MMSSSLKFALGLVFISTFCETLPCSAEEAAFDRKQPLQLKLGDLPNQLKEKRDIVTQWRDRIEKRLGVVNGVFRTKRKLEELEYVELEDLFEFVKIGQFTLPDGTYLLDSVGDKCALPVIPLDGSYQFFVDRLESWRDARPKAALPHSLLARLYVQWAWQARGSGAASSVSDENAKLFAERMASARSHADDAQRLGKNDPTIFYQQIKISQALGDSPEQILKYLESSHAAGDYYFRSHEGAAEYFLPRWHGEVGDIENLASWSKENLGAEASARIALMANNYDPHTIFVGSYKKQDLVAGAQVLLKKYPKNLRFANLAGIIAYVAQDKKLGQEASARIKKRYDQTVWHSTQIPYLFESWVESADIPGLKPDHQHWLDPRAAFPLQPQAKNSGFIFSRLSLLRVLFSLDVESGEVVPVLASPVEQATQFAIAKDQSAVVCWRAGREGIEPAIVVLPKEDKEPYLLKDIKGRIGQVMFFDGGKRVVVTNFEEPTAVWNVATGEREREFDSNLTAKGRSLDMHCAPDQKAIAFLTRLGDAAPEVGMSLTVVDGETGKQTTALTDTELSEKTRLGNIHIVSFDGISKMVLKGRLGNDQKAKEHAMVEFDLSTKVAVQLLKNDAHFSSCAASPDGNWLLAELIGNSSVPTRMTLVQRHTKEAIQLGHGEPDKVGFTGDSKHAYVVANGLLSVWKLEKDRKAK